VSGSAFLPDARQVVSGSGNKTVQLWDAVTGAVLQTLDGHSGWIDSVAFLPDGRQVVSGSTDKTVQLWDAATGTVLQTLESYSDYISSVILFSSVAFSPKSQAVNPLLESKDWIVEYSTNILWLPIDYRSLYYIAV
jgi:WD40 repeat protein